jgi:2-polyprenyl-3-methyl-5-hydroxy-6-metoxy-1,4-benzoquinol methylase
MSQLSTCQQILERYNTYSGRPTVQDEKVRSVTFKSFERVLRPWLPPNRAANILDVACGEGSLLVFLRELGYRNISGCDISPENVAICHQLGLTFVQQFDALRLLELPGVRQYDVIFAMDIVEHLPKADVGSFLTNVRQLLRPGGYVIIQTLNMGSVLACYHRYNDLTHEFGVTEKSAVSLLLVAGYEREGIEIRPVWNATTVLGRLREVYLRLLHRSVFLTADTYRPRISTKNLIMRAVAS